MSDEWAVYPFQGPGSSRDKIRSPVIPLDCSSIELRSVALASGVHDAAVPDIDDGRLTPTWEMQVDGVRRLCWGIMIQEG